MVRQKKRSASYYKRQIRLWGTIAVLLFVLGRFVYQRACSKPEQSVTAGQSAPETFSSDTLENVQIVSIYDGDTFKINLDCSLAAYCDKVSVRVRGVDTPEMKGKTKREKELAQKAKAFTKDFLAQTPVTLRNCGRDKYFRLLCDVSNASGKDLAQELIKRDLGYAYDGGKKSDKYQ